MEEYKPQENKSANKSELKEVIASLSQFQKDTEDFGQPIVNMSNKNSAEEVENKVKTINEINKDILSKMGIEVYVHKIIHFDDENLKLINEMFSRKTEYYGDINSINVLALKLLDGEKFANYVTYLDTLVLRCNEENPSKETIINFYKEKDARGDDAIFYFLENDLFKKFDFYIDQNLVEDPNDSLFEVIKNGEKIVDSYRNSYDQSHAEKMEDTILSLKNGYYKEYRDFSDGPGTFSSFGGNIQFLPASRVKGDIKLEEIYKKDFKETWEQTWYNEESNLDIEREHFKDLLKISENLKAIEDKLFLREITDYFVFFKKSLEAAEFYYDGNLDEKFKDKFKKLFFEFRDALKMIQENYTNRISKEKSIEISNILDETEVMYKNIKN